MAISRLTAEQVIHSSGTWSTLVIKRLLFVLSFVWFSNHGGSLLWAQSDEPSRPNIILIMADDMGYGDPRCFNPDSRIPTPNIDQLARQGLRFTDAHAPASVCVPTRYGLLTGRYPFRSERSERVESRIEPGRMTLASLLSGQGYTTACLGKWHQGFDGGKVRQDYAMPLKGGPVDRG